MAASQCYVEMWSWKYRRPPFVRPWRANSTFLTTSHLDKNVELHILIRGGIGLTRRLGAGLPHTECLNERMDTLPRTRASHEPMGYHRGMKTLGDHLGSIRCSSGLRFQLFGVETFLLLPKCQSNGRDLARQRQTSHLRLHALGQQSRVKIMEWSRTTAGPGGRTLEDLLHLMVVVLIRINHIMPIILSRP